MHCSVCNQKIEFKGRLEFRARCSKCDAPLHICLNCRFYDKTSYNQCRETKAERIVEKKRENRCEYFSASDAESEITEKDNFRDRFNDLFK